METQEPFDAIEYWQSEIAFLESERAHLYPLLSQRHSEGAHRILRDTYANMAAEIARLEAAIAQMRGYGEG